MSTDYEMDDNKPVKRGTIHGLWSAKHIPDGTDFPDPYEVIGDVYERSQAADEWEILDPKSKSLPYLAHIKSLSTSWRTLRQLADWMQVGTTPLRWREIKEDPEERQRRVNKTNVTFIEYQPASKPKAIPIKTHSALRETLQSLSHERMKEAPQRLFIVEDLSQQVVELLGERFDIDPLFFREQIEDYVWYNTRDQCAMPPSLVSNMKRRQWFRMRSIRLRYHKTKQEFENSRQEANQWNVLRRPDNDENHWHYQDSEGSVVSIIRTRTMVWIGKDKKCGNGTVGIVLLDPTVSQGQPLWYDRSNWLPMPKINTTVYPSIKSSVSWFEDIVQMTTAFPWFEQTEGHEINAQVLAKPTIYTICAEWLVVCDYVKARLSQIEWELEMPRLFRSKGDAIDTSLRRLHTWRRQIPVFREMITETLEHALPAAARLTTPSPRPSTTPSAPSSPLSYTARSVLSDEVVINFDSVEGFEDIVPDFRRVLAAVNVLQERVDRLTSIVTSEISIEDSRRGLEENHNMARITWLATIFIPLTFISGLYSMNESVSALRTTYGWYFLTAVPFTLIVMTIGWVAGGGSLTPWRKDSTTQIGMIGGRDKKKTK
ncbi:magnesium transport protein [Stemphylium lycopersici]|uniref:Magnesium transport protein n=1 Tax=Stemphylium lycopersici TaxID=183478 RepID=A0A364NFK1_STELY|nr:magnesium transport protein [Stemphylium lycopersici]RAR15883.1 magnesium transport protein [Stemphylium lycopersici]